MENHDLPELDSDAKLMETLWEIGLEAQFLEFRQNFAKNNNQLFLVIKNFGALKDVTLHLKPKSLLIGKNNTGKSTIAKLLAILLNNDFLAAQPTTENFIECLANYDINYLKPDTVIFIFSKLGFFIYKNTKITSVGINILNFLDDNKRKAVETFERIKLALPKSKKNQIALFKAAAKSEEVREKLNIDEDFEKTMQLALNMQSALQMLSSIYIPAERGIISLLSGSLYSLLSKRVALADFIKDFGAQFELARKDIKQITIKSMSNIEYAYEDDKDKIYFDQQGHILLSQAASGIRGLVPLYIVMAAQLDKPLANFIIEEPEINLHPIAQKGLVNFMAEATANEGHSFITTTHSPYILSAFNNLIVAGTLAEENPALAQEIAAIIPQESWIKYDDVSAYVLENGTARSILDPEWKAIVADEIDKASEEIAQEYDQLLALKYRGNSADE